MTTDDPDVCGPHPHLHFTPAPAVLVFHGPMLVLDGMAVALFLNQTVAERVVELLARHGLVDVPDTPAEVACPWPPPDPDQRLCN